MATDLVTFKLDEKFLEEVDDAVERSNFSNRTDFIRAALRDKVDELRFREIYERLGKFKGIAKKKKQTTDADIRRVREKVFREFVKENGWG